MTPKQERFVQEYLVDLNATQAAIRAGYSPATANEQGARLLAKASVLEAVHAQRQEVVQKTKITQAWVIERLASVAERCLQAEPVFNRKGEHVETETPDGTMAKAYRFDAAGANGALGLLGKHLGMFVDRVEHSGSVETRHRVDVRELPPEYRDSLRQIVRSLTSEASRPIEGSARVVEAD